MNLATVNGMIEFLRERLEEDEAKAKFAEARGKRYYMCEADDHGEASEPIEQWSDGSDRLPNHHATWALIYDPVRALDEVAATRRLFRRYDLALAAQDPPSALSYNRAVDRGYIEAHQEAIRDAVNVHARHPDFQEGWKP